LGRLKGLDQDTVQVLRIKIDKFRSRPRHQIFVEPQTLEANEYYLNGLSTSLPVDVQRDMIHSIKGLEPAEIVRYGYAIEYDFIQPTELKLYSRE